MKNNQKELKKCRYGREEEVEYFDFESGVKRRFECPRDAVVEMVTVSFTIQITGGNMKMRFEKLS
ncbi:MAG: hypothetical protein J7L07_04265 [Candidatus Odinarchaeota archaeon]|nr:hypothetical protein [Candidatus Odinarchaeota archaeon]